MDICLPIRGLSSLEDFMIVGIIIYIFSFIIGIIGAVLGAISRGFTIWPKALLDGFTYFFSKLMDFNILFPVDTFLTVFKWLLGFLVIYGGVKILFKIFNYFRGSDSL